MPEILSLNNFNLAKNGFRLVYGKGPLPPYSLRLKYKQGTTPTFSKGTGVLIDYTNNIWDLTYENSDWYYLLSHHTNLIEVIEANTENVVNMGFMFYNCQSLTVVNLFDTSNVTNMNGMFDYCTSLTSIPLFNTSNVTNMISMFYNCQSLTSIPLFDTSNVTKMDYMLHNCQSLTTVPLFNTSSVTSMNDMLNNCYSVESGALALYQQASTQTNPPKSYYQCFLNCGRDTQTGSAELAQIPSSWGGTGA